MPDLAELDELLDPLTKPLTYVDPFFLLTTDVVFTRGVDDLAHLTRDVPGALSWRDCLDRLDGPPGWTPRKPSIQAQPASNAARVV